MATHVSRGAFAVQVMLESRCRRQRRGAYVDVAAVLERLRPMRSELHDVHVEPLYLVRIRQPTRHRSHTQPLMVGSNLR